MRGLHIHRIKSNLPRQNSGLHIFILQCLQFGVRNHAVVAHVRPIQIGIPRRNHRRRLPLRPAVASGMGQLQHGIRLIFRGPAAPDPGEQLPESVLCPGSQIKLPGIGSAVLRYRICLQPDKSGSAFCKTFIPAKSQFIRGSVLFSVTPFHGLNGQSVGDGFPANRQWAGKNGPILRQRKLHTVFCHCIFKLLQRVHMKTLMHCHDTPPDRD